MSQLLRSVFLRSLRCFKGSHIQLTGITTPTSTFNTADDRQPQDMVMQTLQSSSSSNELLNTVSRHLQVMNHKHMLQVLRSLFELNKDPRKDEMLREIQRNPTFGSVCQALKSKARMLELNDYVEALKILSYLKIPIDTSIQQTFLQLIRSNINEFNIRQIIFIDFLISRYDDKNPLVDALKLALPLVFQIRLPLELDHEDLPLLSQMFNYSCVHALPDRCINNIVTGILMHNSINVKTAMTLLMSLSYINISSDEYPTRVKLLHQCFDVLSDAIDRVTPDDVLRLIWRLRSRVLDKHVEFYYPPIWDAFGDYIVNKRLDLRLSILIGRELGRIGHVHMPMLEHLVNAAHENCEAVAQLRPNLLLNFIHCLSYANYKLDSAKWDDIKQQISRNNLLQIVETGIPYILFAVESASLGFYDKEFLSKLYSKEVMNQYFERKENRTQGYTQILILHEAAKVFCDGYKLSPPEDVLQYARNHYPLSTHIESVEDALTRGLGGKQYHIQNVQLPSGIIADEIIALDAGRPVEFKRVDAGKVTQLEELQLPHYLKVICVMKFNRGCYALNADRLKGPYCLLLDVLERQGFSTVPLNIHTWLNMPASERVPYLMRDINSKLMEAGQRLSTVD